MDIKEWVQLCYQVAGKIPEFISVDDSHSQRSYFCFHDYGYVLDVSRQNKLLKNTKPLEEGLRESFEWYMQNQDKVRKKPYFEYITENIK